MKKTFLTVCCLMLFGSIGLANVTNPFSVAMLEAEKVVLVKVEETRDKDISVGLLKTFKGKLDAKRLNLKMHRQLKGVVAGDICFLVLNKDNSIYVSPFGCGSHSVIVIRKGKVHKGIFKYQRNKDKTFDYSRNDKDFDSFDKLQKGIIAELKKEKRK